MTKNNQLAFIFPGQGSQSIGMSAALAEKFPVVKEAYAEASSVLGYDLWKLEQEGPEPDLNMTARTQPALLAASFAVWRVWQACGGAQPAFMAGHSLGEYSALVCAGSIAFKDAIRLVADRGTYMQEAVPQGTGGMAAILGLDDEQVIALCKDAAQGQSVAAANFNTPGQVVIAGHREAVERALQLAAATGAKRSVLLPVSVPSHCELMKPAADRLTQRIAAINVVQPVVPVIHNVDVTSRSDAGDIRQALVEQLYRPVRWVEIIEFLTQQGVTTVVECGPGKVLSGLVKRINRELNIYPVFDPVSLDKALTSI